MNGFSNAIFNKERVNSQETNTYSNTMGNNTANPDSVTANDVRPLLDQLLNTGAVAALLV